MLNIKSRESYINGVINWRCIFKLNALCYIYYALIFCALVLPTGHIGFLNVKLLLFVAICFALPYMRIKFTNNDLLFISFGLFFCLIWLFIGVMRQANESLLPLAQFRAFFVTISIPIIGYLLLKNRLIKRAAIFEIIVYAMVVISISKISMTILAATMGLSFITLTDNIARYFGTQIMTMEIVPGIYRLQIPADLGVPIAMFVVLFSKEHEINYGLQKKIIFITALMLSAFISYGRYVWGYVAIVIILRIITSQSRYIMSAAFVVVGLLLIILFSTDLKVIIDRFYSNATSISDAERFRQYPELFHEFLSNPWIGRGFGAYLPGLIRDHNSKFSYEAQWFGFLMQLGLIGVSCIFVMVLTLLNMILRNLCKFSLLVALILIIWLASGFFNPYLTSSIAGTIFLYFVAIADKMRESRPLFNLELNK